MWDEDGLEEYTNAEGKGIDRVQLGGDLSLREAGLV
jgi:hypothetical protein